MRSRLDVVDKVCFESARFIYFLNKFILAIFAQVTKFDDSRISAGRRISIKLNGRNDRALKERDFEVYLTESQ